jgi:hypothetical protein
VPNALLNGPALEREFAWGMPSFLLVMTLLPLSRESDRPGARWSICSTACSSSC